MSRSRLSLRICLLALISPGGKLIPGVQSFATPSDHIQISHSFSQSSNNACNSVLFATKKKKKKAKKNNAKNNNVFLGGFGGAAMEACPCGAPGTYSSCCSPIHKDVQKFRKATPKEIVQARYAAYSRKLPEFLMMSTHPNNAAFNPDLKAWKESIK